MQLEMNSTEETWGAPSLAVEPSICVYVVLASVGMLLNGLVLVIIGCRDNKLFGVRPRILVLNRTCSDLLGCAMASLKYILTLTGYRVPTNWLGTLLCRLWEPGFLSWSAVQVSILNLMLFTLERYLSVVHPFRHRKIERRHLYACVAVCWVAGFLIELPTTAEGLRVDDRCETYPRNSTTIDLGFRLFGVLIFNTYLVIPLVTYVYCYSRMIYELNRQVGKNKVRQRVKRQLAKTVIFLGCSYLLLFAPDALTFFLYSQGWVEFPFGGWWGIFCVVCINVLWVLNPLAIVTMKKFRGEFGQSIRRPTETRQQPDSDEASDIQQLHQQPET